MKGLIFTYLLTYGGAVASLWRPFYGLLIYICFAIIKPESMWHWSLGGGSGNFSRIIALALLAGWAINGFGNFRFGKSGWIVGSLVAFWFWVLVSTVMGNDTAAGLVFLENLAKIVLPVVVGATLIENLDQLKQLAWTIVITLGYAALELNRSYFDGFNVLQQYGYASLDNNSYAIGLVTGVGVAFFLGFGSKKLWQKLLAFACAALMAHAIFFSFSRGGMLALCIVGVMTFWLIPKRPSYLAWFALGVVTAVMMAGPEVINRFTSAFADEEQRDASAESRVIMWKACLTIMSEHPVTGLGPDQFPNFVHLYTQYSKGKEAHSLWLQLGAELGVPGVAFLFTYYFLTLWGLCRLLRQHRKTAFKDEFARHVPRMVIASLVGFMVAAQFVSLEGLELPYYVALLGAGAIKLNGLKQLGTSAKPARRVVWVEVPHGHQQPQPVHA